MNPLRNIIILLLISFSSLAFAGEYSSIEYVISPVVGDGEQSIQVLMKIKGGMSGKLVLDLPYKLASSSFVEQIDNIKLVNSTYKLRVSKESHHQLTITIPKPVEEIAFSYEIHQKDPQDKSEVTLSTLINKNFIHSPG